MRSPSSRFCDVYSSTEKKQFYQALKNSGLQDPVHLSDTFLQAVQRQEQLEKGVQCAQQQDKLLHVMQESLLATDHYLSAHISEPGRPGLVPHEVQRIQMELDKHEMNLVEMRKRKDDVEISKRIHFQTDITQKLLQEVTMKFQFLQKPREFDRHLRECEQTLSEVHEQIPVFCIRTVDQDALQLQLEQYVKCYRCLSELKVDVEEVVKTGRQVARSQLTENPKELHSRLTALKMLYNDLGAKVMTGKRDLESCLTLSQKLQMEVDSMTDWLATTDSELTRRSHSLVMPSNTDMEVAWAMATEKEAEQRKQQLEAVAAIADDLKGLISGHSSCVEHKVWLLRSNWKAVTSRNKEWLHLLLEHQTRMKALSHCCAQISAWMYKTEILLELERDTSQECCRDGSRWHSKDSFRDYVVQGLQLELEDMRVKLVAVQDQGLTLIRTQGEPYRGLLQSKLDVLRQRFEEISQRIQTADLNPLRKTTTPKPLRTITTLAMLPQWYQYEPHDTNLLQWLDNIERNIAKLSWIHSTEDGKGQLLGPPAPSNPM